MGFFAQQNNDKNAKFTKNYMALSVCGLAVFMNFGVNLDIDAGILALRCMSGPVFAHIQ